MNLTFRRTKILIKLLGEVCEGVGEGGSRSNINETQINSPLDRELELFGLGTVSKCRKKWNKTLNVYQFVIVNRNVQ